METQKEKRWFTLLASFGGLTTSIADKLGMIRVGINCSTNSNTGVTGWGGRCHPPLIGACGLGFLGKVPEDRVTGTPRVSAGRLALTHGHHDVSHVRELLRVQEGCQLLPSGPQVPILVSRPETPLVSSQHLLVGLRVFHVVKFFT